MEFPLIIQGGMGVAVSDWRLARAVSRTGELGVVSGTALSLVLVRRLQAGDPGGHVRRSLARFPWRAVADSILAKYFVADGIEPTASFALSPLPQLNPSLEQQALTVAACFVEVDLAKEGHDGAVGINLLEKIQLPTLASLYGAMLAGVDYVLMGAGIPRQIPGLLDLLAKGLAAEMKIDVSGASDHTVQTVRFDPAAWEKGPPRLLTRPRFLAVISSVTLALTLAKKSSGRVDGFVIEAPIAGGHNAPPRGGGTLDERGQPLYGPRDAVDLAKIREIGLPFWLAGAYSTPEKLEEARALGAAGVQVGTAFAFCTDSGLTTSLKREVLAKVQQGTCSVYTDRLASPTGFPFKVVELAGTLGEASVYQARSRVCDVGLLREPFVKADGGIGYRCSAEPVETYLRKGGEEGETVGRKCLCNGLAAAAGLAQRRGGLEEPPLLTAGDDLVTLARFLPEVGVDYTAQKVIDTLRGSRVRQGPA